jgi:hypothetical protein
MEVGNAARAGADYAQANTYDSTNITSAVQNATSLSVQADPAPLKFYGCPDVTSGVSSVSPGTTCPSTSATAGSYVIVSAQSLLLDDLHLPRHPQPVDPQRQCDGTDPVRPLKPSRSDGGRTRGRNAAAAAGNPVAERRHGGG